MIIIIIYIGIIGHKKLSHSIVATINSVFKDCVPSFVSRTFCNFNQPDSVTDVEQDFGYFQNTASHLILNDYPAEKSTSVTSIITLTKCYQCHE